MKSDDIALVREVLRTAAAPTAGDLEPPGDATRIDQVPASVVAHGRTLLRAGKVAALMVAGGQSTRWHGAGLRGDCPIGPVSSRSLFRISGEKLVAVRQRRAPDLLWLVMTSAAVHEAVVDSFRRESFFGFPRDDVVFFPQRSLPVLDGRLEPVVRGGAVLQSPTGHGGLLRALVDADLWERLERRGVEHLFQFQYPNVLEQVCDPRMLGFHDKSRTEVTCKGFEAPDLTEAVGRFARIAGKLRVVEYHQARGRGEPWWPHAPANQNTFVWSLAFLRRAAAEGELPFHGVPHAAPGLDGLRKVEQFVFDLLQRTTRVGLLVGSRAAEYAAVKRLEGSDSVDSARNALRHLYRSWLDGAGAVAAAANANANVEISASFALDRGEVAGRVAPGFRYHDGLVLNPGAPHAPTD